MAPLPDGCCCRCRNLDGSSEPPIFLKASEAESTTSALGDRIGEYHFVLHHKPGALNKKADLLSRCNDHDQGKDDNGDIVVLQPAHFQALIMPMTNEVHTKVEEAT